MKNPRLQVPPPARPPLRQTRSCICVLGRNLTIRWVAGQPACVFQKSSLELRGRNLMDCLPAQVRPRWRKAVQRAMEGEPVSLRQASVGRGPTGMFSVTVFRLPGARAGEELGALVQPVPAAPAGTPIMRFLHDDVAQLLGAAGLELDLLRLDLGSAAPTAVERIDRVQATLEGLMERIRELTRDPQSESQCLPLRKEADALHCSPGR